MLGDLYQLQTEYQTLVNDLSLMMKQYQTAGGTISDAFLQKVTDHTAAVASRISEMGEEPVLSARTAASIAEIKALITEFKQLTPNWWDQTAAAAAAPSNTGTLLKWGLVVVGAYLLYRHFSKPAAVLANSEIPYDELPAYAGGPKRKRRR